MSRAELLSRLNVNRKRVIKENDLFEAPEVPISIIKKIDNFFHKGLSYYADPSEPINTKEESIFFRKDNFNADLNLGAKQIVNRFEEEKLTFSTLAKLSDFNIKRQIPVFNVSNTPKAVADQVRSMLYPGHCRDKRDFLKAFIGKLADNNILVFEFVEAHNKVEKANINGFYLSPNVIVLKRNQKSLKREIFTLAHELGHYILNEEEIDNNIDEVQELTTTPPSNLSTIENWCNDFAYYFLIGNYHNEIAGITAANEENDYHHDQIERLSNLTHLSTISIYTRLLIDKKIAPSNYKKVTDGIIESIRAWEEKERIKMEKEKLKALSENRKIIIPAPKPIISPLYLSTLKNALNTGLINEMEFCTRLSVSVDKINKFLS